jgi:hypothetical protein
MENIAKSEKRFGIMPLEVGWADWVGKINYYFSLNATFSLLLIRLVTLI